MISAHERLSIIVELIALDLKIHKHLFFLEQSGLETNNLNLIVHDKIFKLVGIDAANKNEEIRELYYQMVEQSSDINVLADEVKLLERSALIFSEISDQLNSKS